MGSEDQSDFQKTRQNNFDLHCYNERSDESHWDTSRFNLDQVRIWSTLGETPRLNVRGFHGKELCVEKVLEDFGSKTEPWSNQIWMELIACLLLGAHSVTDTVDGPKEELPRKPNGAHDCACCWTSKLRVTFI